MPCTPLNLQRSLYFAMNLKLDISFFIRHCYYLNRVNIKNQKSKRFRCNNSVCEHTAIATKIGFDNQLPSRIARLNAKGETSIDCELDYFVDISFRFHHFYCTCHIKYGVQLFSTDNFLSIAYRRRF